jgi:hypothetical protein
MELEPEVSAAIPMTKLCCVIAKNTTQSELSRGLTLSNPIFLPTASPQLLFVLGGKEVGGLLVIILQF